MIFENRERPLEFLDPYGLFDWDTGEIEEGDTLADITYEGNQKYGTDYDFYDIAEINDISDPNRINAGDSLTLPEEWGHGVADDAKGTAPSAAAAPSAEPTSTPEPVVDSGEKVSEEKSNSSKKKEAEPEPSHEPSSEKGSIYNRPGIPGSNFFGTYNLGSQRVGIDTSGGNVNFSGSSTTFREEQNDSIVLGVPDAKVALGSSQTLFRTEAFAGIKNGNTIGIGAGATALALEGKMKVTLFGYGIGINASLNLGTAQAGLMLSTKMIEVKLGLLAGATIRLTAISPK